nr:MAG TPA: hypothetical protein [Caudoviricetes sp.]
MAVRCKIRQPNGKTFYALSPSIRGKDNYDAVIQRR